MSGDDYEFDVFLSYRRFGLWPHWVERIFLPLFTHWLGEELGDVPRIFADHQLEVGCTWPTRLGDALAHSRILVPLWSRQYFISDWCKAELAYMRAREVSCGLREKNRPEGLIVPALLHDGQDLPRFVQGIKPAHLQAYANVRMTVSSPSAEKLELQIKAWVPSVVRAIQVAPPFESSWRDMAIDSFMELFQIAEPRQVRPPLVKAS